MEKLEVSLPQQIGSSSESDHSTSPRQQRARYASERARLLFGQYRKGDANDPETYVATVAAILAEYPGETIRHVTDPRTGIAANPRPDPDTGRVWTGMPNPGDVRIACEAHYGPTKRAIEREAAERRQLAERKTLAIADGRPRKTYEQLIEECRAAGLNIGPKKIKAKPVDVDALCASAGITREQFDKLPNAPDRR